MSCLIPGAPSNYGSMMLSPIFTFKLNSPNGQRLKFVWDSSTATQIGSNNMMKKYNAWIEEVRSHNIKVHNLTPYWNIGIIVVILVAGITIGLYLKDN
jgi:hypothetical protein